MASLRVGDIGTPELLIIMLVAGMLSWECSSSSAWRWLRVAAPEGVTPPRACRSIRRADGRLALEAGSANAPHLTLSVTLARR